MFSNYNQLHNYTVQIVIPYFVSPAKYFSRY